MNFTWSDHKNYKIARADGHMIMLGPFSSGWQATLYAENYRAIGSITFVEEDVEKAKERAIRMLSTCMEKFDAD